MYTRPNTPPNSVDDLRAARSYLNLSQDELGKFVGLSDRAIGNAEMQKFNLNNENKRRLIDFFKTRGIEFLPGGGFRPFHSTVFILEGSEGVKNFFEDVLETAKKEGGEFLVSDVNEEEFVGASEKAGIIETYPFEMQKLYKEGRIKLKVLISEEDSNPHHMDYVEYRAIPKDWFTSVPKYIYGDKVATILWNNHPEIIIHQNARLADAERKQFDLVWKTHAKPL